MVDAPVRAPPRTIPNPERARAIGFTPGCRAKYLSSYCSVASIRSGEMCDRGVQIRNFWSEVNVTRSNSPLRYWTHCENETPSSSGGFGRNSHASTAVIPSRARDLAHEARITRDNLCDPSPFERSLSPSRTGITFGMTCVFMSYSVTVILPPTPRPLMFRSYIDSAKTGGTTNSPRFVDLIW